MNRITKRIIGAIVTSIGGGISFVFILSGAWFGVALGAFIGLFGVLALMYPDDAFPAVAKKQTVRGVPKEPDSDGA